MQPLNGLRFALSILGLLLAVAGNRVFAGTHNFKPTQATFLNPERGLYGHGALVNRTSFARLRDSGVSLVYAPIFLREFRETSISQERLDEISNALDRMRSAGLKGIVRVSYSRRIGMPDAPLSRVEEHLVQLAPIFEQNKDIIAFFQAGFIGAWGEWHSSTNHLDSASGKRSVMQLLLKHLPEERFIQVRTPMYKWELFEKPVSEQRAFSSDPVARIGHHNDCFLANETDMGTYPRKQLELWKGRLANDTLYVPIGGETCRESRWTTCDVAQRELERLHWTYLNRDYHRAVLRALAPCWSTIVNRLGYRYELISCELPDVVSPGETFEYSLWLKNVGYAPMYNSRPVFLRVIQGAEVVADSEVRGVDPRRWLPGKTVGLHATAKLPENVTSGTIGLALWLPDSTRRLRDRPEYSVRFANDDVWDQGAGHNVLIQHLPVK